MAILTKRPKLFDVLDDALPTLATDEEYYHARFAVKTGEAAVQRAKAELNEAERRLREDIRSLHPPSEERLQTREQAVRLARIKLEAARQALEQRRAMLEEAREATARRVLDAFQAAHKPIVARYLALLEEAAALANQDAALRAELQRAAARPDDDPPPGFAHRPPANLPPGFHAYAPKTTTSRAAYEHRQQLSTRLRTGDNKRFLPPLFPILVDLDRYKATIRQFAAYRDLVEVKE